MAKLEQESGIKLTEDNTEEAISPKETGFYDNSCMDTNKPSNKNSMVLYKNAQKLVILSI